MWEVVNNLRKLGYFQIFKGIIIELVGGFTSDNISQLTASSLSLESDLLINNPPKVSSF